MKWEEIKELLADLILIWWGLWTLYLFSHIAIYGYVKGVEPNLWILYVELGLTIAGLTLGVERLIRDIKHYEN